MDRWEGKGFPERIISLVRNGAKIEPFEGAVSAQESEKVEKVDPRSVARLDPGCFVDADGQLKRFKVERGQ